MAGPGPFGLRAFDQLGMSPALAAQYVQRRRLIRLAKGVYAFTGSSLDVYGSLAFLQDRTPELHIGGRAALELGLRGKALPAPSPLVVWGATRMSFPQWFAERFPARYVSAKLFDWPEGGPCNAGLFTFAALPAGPAIAAPERAVLELLYEVGQQEGLDAARALFEELGNLRLDILCPLLEHCRCVKVVRLFLHWARLTRIVDVDALRNRCALPVGSRSRWVGRMKDGALLTIPPCD
ncbi:MAG: hypothetical protein JWR07_3842 [Nevskia sp.]|nr:hypothetical protein [Nevskia sp.]